MIVDADMTWSAIRCLAFVDFSFCGGSFGQNVDGETRFVDLVFVLMDYKASLRRRTGSGSCRWRPHSTKSTQMVLKESFKFALGLWTKAADIQTMLWLIHTKKYAPMHLIYLPAKLRTYY